jgi:urease accessory protein
MQPPSEENVMRRSVLERLTAALVLVPTVVLAHTWHADTSGLLHGFMHPLTGIDHVLAMIAVGVLAAQLGRGARWLVPLAFVGVMMVGGGFGMAGISVPFAELAVAASVVVLGLAIAFAFRLHALAVVTLVSFFALFHGHVHGAEMPGAASMLAYTAGFVGATALLHLIGVTLGILLGLPDANRRGRLAHAGGGAMALFGIVLLTGLP